MSLITWRERLITSSRVNHLLNSLMILFHQVVIILKASYVFAFCKHSCKSLRSSSFVNKRCFLSLSFFFDCFVASFIISSSLTAKIIADDFETAIKAKSMSIDWLMLLKFNQASYDSVDMSWLNVMMMIVYYFTWRIAVCLNLHIRLNKIWSNPKYLWSNRIKNENRMKIFLIEWEKFSFESPINFSAVADGLPEQVRGGTPYLFRMIGHEWKKLQNLSNPTPQPQNPKPTSSYQLNIKLNTFFNANLQPT